MYKLELTKAERDAIDWVGYRYWHGDDFKRILLDCDISCAHTQATKYGNISCEWDSECDLTFHIPEYAAWSINDNLMEDNLACFADELVRKLLDFCAQIV